MAKEYIEREAALSAQNKSLNLAECRKRLERLPAADVAPVVRGQWIDSELDGVPSHCSECNYPIERFYKTHFCPNCGADMREVTPNG